MSCTDEVFGKGKGGQRAVRVPKTASPAVLRERACTKDVTPGTSTAASLAISVVRQFSGDLVLLGGDVPDAGGYQDGKGGPGDLRPPSRPSGEDPPLPSRRPPCRASGPAPMRARTDCVSRAERLRLTADRSRNKNTIESPVIKT